MQRPEWDDTRVGVIRRLQSIIEKVPPGTETYEIADHAIDLALSTNREGRSAALLFRNVWRNARYILRRRRDLILDPLNDDSVIGRQIADGELVGAAAPETPEDQLVAVDLAARIRGAAARLDRRGAECFDGLVIGETLVETARSLNITPRRVKRMRAQIRAMARELAYGEQAA
jgi:hypothetical protein